MGRSRQKKETFMIKEIFGPTIQGEGSQAGRKVLFVRFAGCNRWSGRPEDRASSACPFCDTDFYGGKKMSGPEIAQELVKLNKGHAPRLPVILSGGEPTLQIDEGLLVELRCWFGEIHLETNGSKAIPRPTMFKHITMSPKQSIEKTKLQYCHDLKLLYPFVNNEITLLNFLDFPAKNIYLQPIEEDGFFSKLSVLNRRLTTDYILQTVIPRKELKYSGQLHKLIEVK